MNIKWRNFSNDPLNQHASVQKLIIYLVKFR